MLRQRDHLSLFSTRGIWYEYHHSTKGYSSVFWAGGQCEQEYPNEAWHIAYSSELS